MIICVYVVLIRRNPSSILIILFNRRPGDLDSGNLGLKDVKVLASDGEDTKDVNEVKSKFANLIKQGMVNDAKRTTKRTRKDEL